MKKNYSVCKIFERKSIFACPPRNDVKLSLEGTNSTVKVEISRFPVYINASRNPLSLNFTRNFKKLLYYSILKKLYTIKFYKVRYIINFSIFFFFVQLIDLVNEQF